MPLPLPRLHLFELEDQPWFPSAVRDYATDYLEFVERTFGLHKPMVPLLAAALRETGSTSVIDLCSGGGGPVVALAPALTVEGIDVRFTLTDRYPNLPAFQTVAAASAGRIRYAHEPVNALDVPRHLQGFRTLFNAFHHFRPADAIGILNSAVEARQPIGIFEVSERSLVTLLSMLFLTLPMVLLGTPFVRPFDWRRLLLTYLLPVVPLTCWWDGVISQLRAYTVDELETFIRAAPLTSYTWRVGRVPIPSTPAHVTYLIGRP